MALQLQVTLDNGIEVASSYARINHVRHDHTHTYVQVHWWANAQARHDQKPIIKETAHYVTWEEPISIQSCYNALKLLPEFAGAQDV